MAENNDILQLRYADIYVVKYPMGSHLDFIALSFSALKKGLKTKYAYKPVVYILDGWQKSTPKLRRLTSVQLKAVMEEIKLYS